MASAKRGGSKTHKYTADCAVCEDNREVQVVVTYGTKKVKAWTCKTCDKPLPKNTRITSSQTSQ